VRAITDPSTNQVIELQYKFADQVTNSYSIDPKYLTKPAARQIEGGAKEGVIAWGRWAGGQALIGSYGPVSFSNDNGIHWISGDRIVSVSSSFPKNWTFNLVGGTTPTEARPDALPGWRLTGGKFDAEIAGTGALISNGVLNLYYARETDGWGNYVMNFAGNGMVSTTEINGVVTRVNGTANICTGPCNSNGALGFYGSSSSKTYAGITYQFNSRTDQNPLFVQGAAVFDGISR
jgi:hypothetical protein